MGRKEEILEKVRAIASPLAAQEGLELVDVALGGAGRTELTLYIDKAEKPGGGEVEVVALAPLGAAGFVPGASIGLEDCANFSRIVSTALDVEDPLEGAYELVVSSPGLDRPMRTPEHFARYKGQRCRVKTYAPVPECNNLKTFVGTLEGYDPERKAVLVDVDGTHYVIPHAQVSKANLDPVFEF
jgi:ribosome maturation factor RimP